MRRKNGDNMKSERGRERMRVKDREMFTIIRLALP